MSVFKTKWIILKIDKPKDKDFLYTVFTYDFGKIRVSKKKNTKEKTLDLGYIVNAEIRTKEGFDIHKISNIKIISEFDYKEKDFELIQKYLEILAFVTRQSPDWVALYEAFAILETINKYKNIDTTKLLLTKLKLMQCFWSLDISHKDLTVQKVLKFIDNRSIHDVLKLIGIQSDIERKLEEIFDS